MSKLTTRDATNNFLAADTDRSKTFIFNNEFETGTLLNASGGELTYKVGTLLGRVSASNKLVPMASAANNGSQYPIGVLAEEVTLANNAEQSINFCIAGEVNVASLVLDGTDTLTTVISGRTIGDRIKSDTKGISLRTIEDSTFYDN